MKEQSCTIRCGGTQYVTVLVMNIDRSNVTARYKTSQQVERVKEDLDDVDNIPNKENDVNAILVEIRFCKIDGRLFSLDKSSQYLESKFVKSF